MDCCNQKIASNPSHYFTNTNWMSSWVFPRELVDPWAKLPKFWKLVFLVYFSDKLSCYLTIIWRAFTITAKYQYLLPPISVYPRWSRASIFCHCSFPNFLSSYTFKSDWMKICGAIWKKNIGSISQLQGVSVLVFRLHLLSDEEFNGACY